MRKIIVAIGAIVVLVCSVWLLGGCPTVVVNRVAPKEEQCKRNLLAIGLAIMRYQDKNNDRMPDSIVELYPEFISDPGVFVCPADEEMVRLWKHVHRPADVQKMLREGKWSYEYIEWDFGHEKVRAYSPSETAIMFDKEFRHGVRKTRVTVLFLDGHVEPALRECLLRILRNMLTFDRVSPKQKEHLMTIIQEVETSSAKGRPEGQQGQSPLLPQKGGH